ncbi:MAG: hypothetical protein NTZ33_12635 [Bacteroidetes bacterium]|nr:hypothetical protein [Bacteroidota bacterium]
MKKLILICIAFTLFSCKSTEKQPVKQSVLTVVKGKNSGIVSQQYKAEGCKTVIIVKTENPKEPLILIPMNDFDAKFDKDKLKISFDYLPLRVKNPDGCNVGIPAEITNITLE